MQTQSERAAERRRVKLEEVARQIKTGSLKVRKMTAKELTSLPPRTTKRPGR